MLMSGNELYGKTPAVDGQGEVARASECFLNF